LSGELKSGNKLYAVITADLIMSERLTAEHRDKFIHWIHEFSEDLERRKDSYRTLFPLTLFRGDSFQVVISTTGLAMELALRIHSELASLNHQKTSRYLQTRIAIGVGQITYNRERLEEADGEAFHLSGKLLDEMKDSRIERIRLATPDPEINAEFAIHCMSLDNLIGQWSAAQGKVVSLALENTTQQKIGDTLQESQPAIHQKLRASSFDLVEKISERFMKKMHDLEFDVR